VPERATVSNWSEKSAEVVVAGRQSRRGEDLPTKDRTRRRVRGHVDAASIASDARETGTGGVAHGEGGRDFASDEGGLPAT
jgi:hypothetical protein